MDCLCSPVHRQRLHPPTGRCALILCSPIFSETTHNMDSLFNRPLADVPCLCSPIFPETTHNMDSLSQPPTSRCALILCSPIFSETTHNTDSLFNRPPADVP